MTIIPGVRVESLIEWAGRLHVGAQGTVAGGPSPFGSYLIDFGPGFDGHNGLIWATMLALTLPGPTGRWLRPEEFRVIGNHPTSLQRAALAYCDRELRSK